MNWTVDDCCPGWYLDCSFVTDTKPETQLKHVRGFLTHRNYEIMNVCCVKPLNFGVIYYTAIEN